MTKVTKPVLHQTLFVLVALFVLFAVPPGAQQRPDIPWTRIPAGSFQMGCVPSDMRCDADEQPRHMVTISRPFDMMTTEVTKAMYSAVVADMDDQPLWSTTPDHPVTIVTWDEALKFCQAVGGRLPTEAEWEYAARGGRDATIYPWGNQDPDDRAGQPNGAAFETDAAQPVRTFAANGFGLFGMSGNVWEWVGDFYGAFPQDAATDPQGPERSLQSATAQQQQQQEGGRGQAPQLRVVRGGAYGDDSRNLRASNRNPNQARNANVNVGFRCARSVS